MTPRGPKLNLIGPYMGFKAQIALSRWAFVDLFSLRRQPNKMFFLNKLICRIKVKRLKPATIFFFFEENNLQLFISYKT